MPRIILLSLLLSLLTGCYDDQPTNKHGLSTVPLSQFTYRGVVDRSINLKFKVDKGGVSKLVARVETQYDYTAPLNFEWKLGEGVELSSGLLKGQLQNMKKGTPVEIEIEVTGFTEGVAHFVRFEIIGTNPEKRAFADGILNSQDKSFEKIVQEVEEYKKGN